MSNKQAPDLPCLYAIQVRGRLDRSWSDWFPGLVIACQGEITTLTGGVVDQAALRGILVKLWDLNLVLVSLARIEPAEGQKERELR